MDSARERAFCQLKERQSHGCGTVGKDSHANARNTDFRGNAFNFSPLRVMLAVGLSYIAFIMLRYVPSIPAFWRVLIINGC